jgi:hypothetical protein
MDAGNRLGVFASVKNAGTFLPLNFDPGEAVHCELQSENSVSPLLRLYFLLRAAAAIRVRRIVRIPAPRSRRPRLRFAPPGKVGARIVTSVSPKSPPLPNPSFPKSGRKTVNRWFERADGSKAEPERRTSFVKVEPWRPFVQPWSLFLAF